MYMTVTRLRTEFVRIRSMDLLVSVLMDTLKMQEIDVWKVNQSGSNLISVFIAHDNVFQRLEPKLRLYCFASSRTFCFSKFFIEVYKHNNHNITHRSVDIRYCLLPLYTEPL